MLIKCPECGLQASDKAFSCPHCGYPFQPETKPKATRKSNRKRRLPNGFGQISEIKNRNLRKPFRAMITVGKTETGRPICELLKPEAYFATYNEAYEALVNHQKNPYDVNKDITVKELYERWSVKYFEGLQSSSVRTIENAWKYCSSLYDMKIADLRIRHVKGCMNEGTAIIKGEERLAPPSVKTRIKSLFNNMMDYALEYELIDQNYSRNFKESDAVSSEERKVKREHRSFSDEEMVKIKDHADTLLYADIVMIQCYSGWRPQEIGLIKIENVDLDNWIFNGGMKSAAGMDRIVPIHPKIRRLVARKYKEAQKLKSEYLFNCIDAQDDPKNLFFDYDKYRTRFVRVMKELNIENHRPHDPRKHFVTMCKKYNVDEYAIKYMAGHQIQDITERVYTDRTIEWLRTELEKIEADELRTNERPAIYATPYAPRQGRRTDLEKKKRESEVHDDTPKESPTTENKSSVGVMYEFPTFNGILSPFRKF